MGLIDVVLGLAFGSGRNVIRETAEVFRANAEAVDQRDLAAFEAALAQHAAEFRENRTGFDSFIDALNRLPRPAMALGSIGLFVAAMVDPVWFSERMQGLALVPEALWWLLGAVVSFYFGARHQVKGQEFQREIARTMAQTPQVVSNLRELRRLGEEGAEMSAPVASHVPAPATGVAAAAPAVRDRNAALEEWRAAG